MTDDQERAVYQHEWSHFSPSIAVVESLSDAIRCEPTDLPVLGDAVDADALDRLFSGPGADQPVRISFTYAGYPVTVSSDGTVTVDRLTGDSV